ncbi:MAG: thymidine phosphorylase family protein [Alphaproteobacteria bacterium]
MTTLDPRPKPLRLRRLAIDTYGENVAFLSRHCTSYRPEQFQALNKIEISHNGQTVMATLNIVDDPGILGPDEIGLSEPCFRRFGQADGEMVAIAQAAAPRSIDAIREKIMGNTFSPEDLGAIVADIVAHRYSRMEVAAFLVSSASFMTTDEVLSLTQAMARTGNRLVWPGTPVVDKHSIGGIPGNRTSMIVVPIVAAHGLMIPKTSSRAITSAAGTADTMEVLARVDLGIHEMRSLVEREKGCLVWGGHVNLSPADDILIAVERPLGIDTREQMVASILSKKLAAGSTHLLVDIPLGPTAKIRTQDDANRLRKLFEYIGGAIGLALEVLVTDGSQPIGRGIGPVLEARDVMQVLRNDPDAPQDLREKSLLLAGRILDFDPALKGGQGYARAREILDSGRALAAMERIIAGQGPANRKAAVGSITREIVAPRNGRLTAIDCHRIGRIARLAGAPMDKGAGIDLLKKAGDSVKAGEPVYRIHSEEPADFQFATDMADENPGIIVTP